MRHGHRGRRRRMRNRMRSGAARQWRTQRMNRTARRSGRRRRFFRNRFRSFRSGRFGFCGRLRTRSLGGRRGFQRGRGCLFRFVFYRRGARPIARPFPSAMETAAHFECDIVVERAGVRLLFRDTQFRQKVQDHVRLDFKLASQLIDADFTHTLTNPGVSTHPNSIGKPLPTKPRSAPRAPCFLS